MDVQKNRLAWVEALESGKSAQGKLLLHARDREGVDRYCCLGVACVLAVESGLLPAPERVIDAIGNSAFSYGEGYRVGLPPEVSESFGISSYPLQNDLMIMNDVKGNDFPTIAKFLRKEFAL